MRLTTVSTSGTSRSASSVSLPSSIAWVSDVLGCRRASMANAPSKTRGRKSAPTRLPDARRATVRPKDAAMTRSGHPRAHSRMGAYTLRAERANHGSACFPVLFKIEGPTAGMITRE